MSLAETLLPEFDQETAGTRKLLARAPVAHWKWRPHRRSMTLGELASHVAEILSWAMPVLTGTEFDMAPHGGKPYQSPLYRTRKALLAAFDGNVKAARAALAGMDDRAFFANWSLKSGGEVLFSMPRYACVRTMLFNHLIHHRAQLGVYLRLTNVPLPALYGPSADET